MDKYTSTIGVVFRIFAAKETDKVVHIITADGSRLAAFARGVRKPTSRKAHALDLLNSVKLKLTGNGELATITEAQLVNANSQFKQDYQLLMFSQLICEVVDLFVHENQEEKGYYRNLENLLTVRQVTRPILLAAAFILRYLYISGSLPRLDQDLLSGEELTSEANFLLADPGYTSEKDKSTGIEVPARLVKSQKFILQSDFQTINQLNLSTAEQTQLFQLHVGWLENVVERQLKTAPLFLG